LQFELYHTPFSYTDFIAPSIWQATALVTSTNNYLGFRVQVSDTNGISRVVVLYRPMTGTTWLKAELPYSTTTGFATGSAAFVSGPIEFLVEAVDPSGNVGYLLDHGNPLTGATTNNFSPTAITLQDFHAIDQPSTAAPAFAILGMLLLLLGTAIVIQRRHRAIG
jgi:hypothetical protein